MNGQMLPLSRFVEAVILTNSSSSMSRVTLPAAPATKWYVKLENVCRQVSHGMAHEPAIFPYYNMYPLDTDGLLNATTGFLNGVGELGAGGRIRFSPLAHALEHAEFKHSNVTFFPGHTLMPECFWHSRNPAHLIFPFSALFEWGLSPPAFLPTFDRMTLLRCPSWQHNMGNWDWGHVVMEAALAPLLEKGYFGPKLREEALSPTGVRPVFNATGLQDVIDFPYSFVHSPLRAYKKYQIFCFETVHVVQRWGVIMNSSNTAALFRDKTRDVAKRRGSGKAQVSEQYRNIVAAESDIKTSNLAQRCAAKSLRILILLRMKGWSRNINNADELVDVTRKYTRHIVLHRMFDPPFPLQVSVFNSFDILISMTGSHLTNLLFTNRTDVAVLEVGLAIRDWFWRDNALNFGIKHYLYSHSGHSPDQQCRSEGKVDGSCKVFSDVEDTVVCKPRGKDKWHPIGDCSFFVNVTAFEARLSHTISRLCS